MKPIENIQDFWLHRKVKAAGVDAAHRGAEKNAEQVLAANGLGIPEHWRVNPDEIPGRLIIAEQTASTLKIEVTKWGRAVAKLPNKMTRWLKVGFLYTAEAGSLVYLFVDELGYSVPVGISSSLLFTTGTFALTKGLYVNLHKKPHERAWYTPLLAGFYLVGAGGLVALRLTSSAASNASLATNIAGAIILGFVTFLPGWLAASAELDLGLIHDTTAEYESYSIEYHEETLRIAALRQGYDASSRKDLRILEQRRQGEAIYSQAFDKHATPALVPTRDEQ